jgi:hypothetical protein
MSIDLRLVAADTFRWDTDGDDEEETKAMPLELAVKVAARPTDYHPAEQHRALTTLAFELDQKRISAALYKPADERNRHALARVSRFAMWLREKGDTATADKLDAMLGGEP